MVVNCMIAAIASHSNPISEKEGIIVYQIGSSRRNPVKYDELKWFMHRYLNNNPLFDSCGKPIKVVSPVVLNTMTSFHNYISFHYLPFVQVSLFLLFTILSIILNKLDSSIKIKSIVVVLVVYRCLDWQILYVATFLNVHTLMQNEESKKPCD